MIKKDIASERRDRKKNLNRLPFTVSVVKWNTAHIQELPKLLDCHVNTRKAAANTDPDNKNRGSQSQGSQSVTKIYQPKGLTGK